MINGWDVIFGFAAAYAVYVIVKYRPLEPGEPLESHQSEKLEAQARALEKWKRAVEDRDQRIKDLERILEKSSAQHEAVVTELRQLQELKHVRQIRQTPAGPRDAEDLLRRGYHALRILHDFRRCHLKGCDWCRLGEEMVASIGAHTIQSETTIRKKIAE